MNTTLSFLALGDSYTIGEGVLPPLRWTHQLASLLREEGVPLADPVTIATTGWTTDELAAALDAAAPAHDYDFVTLLIGVNNQYRGRNVHEYAAQFDALLQCAVEHASGRAGRVLVLGFPDWGATRFGRDSARDLAQVARETDAFNAVASAICTQRGVQFVDIAPLGREHADNPAMLAEDGLHPSGAMYALWAAAALPAARALLR